MNLIKMQELQLLNYVLLLEAKKVIYLEHKIYSIYDYHGDILNFRLRYNFDS